MSLFDYTSPSVAVHAAVTALFDSTASQLAAMVPAGPDVESAVSALVEAATAAHVAVDKVPAISPVASEGATAGAGAAPVAGPPPAPEAPATVYVPAVTQAVVPEPGVIRQEPGAPKPGV